MALDPRANESVATDFGIGGEESLGPEELQALFAVSKALATDEPLTERVRRALEKIVETLSAGVVVLRIPDDEGTALRLVAAAGPATTPNAPPKHIELEGTVGGTFRPPDSVLPRYGH